MHTTVGWTAKNANRANSSKPSSSRGNEALTEKQKSEIGKAEIDLPQKGT
jgi:hypothetical protein